MGGKPNGCCLLHILAFIHPGVAIMSASPVCFITRRPIFRWRVHLSAHVSKNMWKSKDFGNEKNLDNTAKLALQSSFTILNLLSACVSLLSVMILKLAHYLNPKPLTLERFLNSLILNLQILSSVKVSVMVTPR